MAYMNQQKKAIIAQNLKPILKKYNVKGTLSVRNNMSIALTVKSGEIDFIKNFNDTVAQQPGGFRNGSRAEKYLSVNTYWFQEHFSGKAKQFLAEAKDALLSAGWYDNSDAQYDYFDTAYYIDINIGKYNKPYEVV
jgi:hypothetical protein